MGLAHEQLRKGGNEKPAVSLGANEEVRGKAPLLERMRKSINGVTAAVAITVAATGCALDTMGLYGEEDNGRPDAHDVEPPDMEDVVQEVDDAALDDSELDADIIEETPDADVLDEASPDEGIEEADVVEEADESVEPDVDVGPETDVYEDESSDVDVEPDVPPDVLPDEYPDEAVDVEEAEVEVTDDGDTAEAEPGCIGAYPAPLTETRLFMGLWRPFAGYAFLNEGESGGGITVTIRCGSSSGIEVATSLALIEGGPEVTVDRPTDGSGGTGLRIRSELVRIDGTMREIAVTNIRIEPLP